MAKLILERMFRFTWLPEYLNRSGYGAIKTPVQCGATELSALYLILNIAVMVITVTNYHCSVIY